MLWPRALKFCDMFGPRGLRGVPILWCSFQSMDCRRRRWSDRGTVLQHGHGEFLKMVATKHMPKPLQRAKEGFDGVVGAVAGALPGVGDKDETDSQASETDQVPFLLGGPLPFPQK